MNLVSLSTCQIGLFSLYCWYNFNLRFFLMLIFSARVSFLSKESFFFLPVIITCGALVGGWWEKSFIFIQKTESSPWKHHVLNHKVPNLASKKIHLHFLSLPKLNIPLSNFLMPKNLLDRFVGQIYCFAKLIFKNISLKSTLLHSYIKNKNIPIFSKQSDSLYQRYIS